MLALTHNVSYLWHLEGAGELAVQGSQSQWSAGYTGYDRSKIGHRVRISFSKMRAGMMRKEGKRGQIHLLWSGLGTGKDNNLSENLKWNVDV